MFRWKMLIMFPLMKTFNELRYNKTPTNTLPKKHSVLPCLMKTINQYDSEYE